MGYVFIVIRPDQHWNKAVHTLNLLFISLIPVKEWSAFIVSRPSGGIFCSIGPCWPSAWKWLLTLDPGRVTNCSLFFSLFSLGFISSFIGRSSFDRQRSVDQVPAGTFDLMAWRGGRMKSTGLPHKRQLHVIFTLRDDRCLRRVRKTFFPSSQVSRCPWHFLFGHDLP